MNLFTREPETLNGYVPKFSLKEVMFDYTSERVQIGGHFKDMDFDPDNIQYTTRHVINVAGVLLHKSEQYGYRPAIEIVVELINEFLANPNSKREYPGAFEFLQKNAEELNNSKRYWLAIAHRNKIDSQKKEIARLQDEVKRAEWIASMHATEVKAERALTKEEKTLLLAEFSGGDYQELP